MKHILGRADEATDEDAVEWRQPHEQVQPGQADGHDVGKVEQPLIGLAIARQRRPRRQQHDHRPLHKQRQRPGHPECGQVEFGVGQTRHHSRDSRLLHRHHEPHGGQRQPEPEDTARGEEFVE